MTKNRNDNERGAALVEYVMLMGVVGVLSLAAASYLGDSMKTQLGLAGDSLAELAEEAKGTCPSGWELVPNTQTKKNGQNVDANDDGLACRKNIPGNGKGNTNQNANVKDNNGPPKKR